MMKEVVLTVGITAHAEGILAHKTMRSVFEALKNLDAEKYPYEIIVHIDSGDEETLKYFARYRNDKRIKIIKSAFRDLGMSRNCIVQHARGKYVAFLDADDLVSSNWYKNALMRLEKSSEPIMVHPSVQLNFGAGTGLCFLVKHDSFEKYQDAIISVGINRWLSAIMGERETFLEFPYMKMENGYGYEDYNLNTRTLGHDIKHMVAPETVMFYRQKAEGSLLASSNSEHVVQPYTELLDIEYFKTFDSAEVDAFRPHPGGEKEYSASGMRKAYYALRGNKYLNYAITPMAKLAKKVVNIEKINEKEKINVPEYILREWKKAAKIETQLTVTDAALREVREEISDNYEVGLAYYDIVKKIPKLPDCLMIVSSLDDELVRRATLKQVELLRKKHPHWTIAVMTTTFETSAEHELPEDVYEIKFGEVAKNVWPTLREMVFSRLITQLKCKPIQVIDSEFAYQWIVTHKKFIEAERELSVVVVNEKFINPDVVDIYAVVKKIYCEDAVVIDRMVKMEAFDEKKIVKV